MKVHCYFLFLWQKNGSKLDFQDCLPKGAINARSLLKFFLQNFQYYSEYVPKSFTFFSFYKEIIKTTSLLNKNDYTAP